MNAPIGIFSTTPDGTFIYVNEYLARVFGYNSPREMMDSVVDIGKQLYADPRDRDTIRRLLEENEEELDFECRFVRRDQSTFWGSYNVRAVRDEKKSIIHYEGFLSDITKRTEEKKSLLRTQFAMDRAPDSVLWIDDEGYIMYANDSSCASLGYTRDELLQMKVFDIDPDFLIDNWEQHKKDMEREGAMTFESRHRTKDGDIFPVEVSTNRFGFNDHFLACTFDRDITERKRMETALRESEEKYRTILDEMEEGYQEVDLAGNYTFCNDAFLRLHGYSKDEILGTNFSRYLADQEDAKRVYDAYHRMYRTGIPIRNFVHDIIRKDGTRRTLEFNAFVLRDSDDRPIGFRGIGRDITERRQADEAAKESEARFRMLFTLSPFPLAHISRDGRILDVNNRLTEVMGHTIDDVPTLEQAWDLALPDAEMKNEITSKWREDLENAIATDADIEPIECPLLCMDGSTRTMIVGTKLLGEGIIVSFFDITDRMETEQAIEFERQQLLSIFNSLNEIIYVSDPSTHELLFTNRYLKDLIGKDPTGGICYKELQLRDRPCDFCTNKIILNNGGLPHSWEFHNVPLGIDAEIVDRIIRWPDGRDVRLEFAKDITDRKRAERELRESESKFRSIFAAMNDVIMILDAEGRYLEIAPTKTDFLYRPPDKLIGKTLHEVFPPERADMFLGAIRDALSQRKTVFLDYELTIGPRQVWFASSISPLSKGRVVHVARDITERKMLEDKFATVFMMAPNVIAVTRMDDGMITDINVGFEEVTGWKRAEVIGKTAYDINFWDNPGEREYMVDKLREGRDVLHQQMRFRRKDGSVLKGIYSARSIRIAGEDNILFILQDVTEQQRTKKVLKEKEAQLRAITANIPGTIFQFYFKKDGEYGINYISQRITEIFGIDRDRENLFQYFVSCIHEDDRKRFLGSVQEAGDSISPWNFEGRFVKNDKTMWFHGRAMPTRHGDRVVYDGFLVDVTDRKRTEEEKEKLQDQLLQSQKLEAVGVLAGGVAHDFNNMLGAIMGYAELTMTKMDPANPFRENLDKILDTAQRSANLTRQLLAFARKQTIDPVVFDLSESVEGLLKMIRRLIGENIELAWFPGKGLGSVRMDPAQFDQVLVNLCVNARDAIADVGKIIIETDTVLYDETYCDAHSYCTPGEYVLLAVSDNGSGMDRETLKHIFEPFFTTKELGRGTGLGLSTVYGIVKQNNGFINIYSEPGKGTTCKIYIPLHTLEAVKTPVPTAEEIPRSRGETILIIEDEPTILDMTTVMLQRLEYTVLAAATPGEAIRIAEEHGSEIHLLITDVVMPEMNGRDLAERLRTIRPTTKILFMSGYTANVIVHHGVLDEGVNFIQKPFSMKGLAAKIREALG